MKKIIVPFLLLSSMAMADIKITEIKSRKEGTNINCKYSYPQFELNGKALTALNNSFKNDIKKMHKVTPKTAENFRPWNRDVNFKQFKNSYGFTSVVIFDELYTGGNHGVTSLRSVNLDEKTGKNLDFNDIFRPEMNKRVEKAIIKYLNKKNEEKGIPFFNPIEEEVITLDKAVFYFDRDFLVVKFEEYAVAPHSSGQPIFRFAKENVVPYMKWKYMKNFPEIVRAKAKK